MGKVTVQFDEVTVRPVSYTEEGGTVVDITYKLNGEEVYTVAGMPLGETGIDIKMVVELNVTSPTARISAVGKGNA